MFPIAKTDVSCLAVAWYSESWHPSSMCHARFILFFFGPPRQTWDLIPGGQRLYTDRVMWCDRDTLSPCCNRVQRWRLQTCSESDPQCSAAHDVCSFSNTGSCHALLSDILRIPDVTIPQLRGERKRNKGNLSYQPEHQTTIAFYLCLKITMCRKFTRVCKAIKLLLLNKYSVLKEDHWHTHLCWVCHWSKPPPPPSQPLPPPPSLYY